MVGDGEGVTHVLGRVRPDGSGHSILARDIPRSFPPAQRPFEAAGDTALYAVLNCDLGAVFVLAPLTAPPRRLSDPSVFAYLPSLSPDGSMVAWGTTHPGGNDLALAPVDGSGVRTLLQGGPGLSVLGWSPDSQALVFQVSPVPALGLPC